MNEHSVRSTAPVLTPAGCAHWLADFETRIHTATPQRAALSVSRDLVLPWQIDRDKLARRAIQGWAAKVFGRLTHVLRAVSQEVKGYPQRNPKVMRALARVWSDADFVQASHARLPRYHQLAQPDKLRTEDFSESLA